MRSQKEIKTETSNTPGREQTIGEWGEKITIKRGGAIPFNMNKNTK